MISLSWKIKELDELNEMGRLLREEITFLRNGIKESDGFWQQENVPSQLKGTRKKMISFVKGVTRHQRTAATHVLVP